MEDIINPGVLFRKAPSVTPVPLVLDSPHSGTSYPDDFNYVSDLNVLRRAEDTYVHELYGAAPSLGAVLIGAEFPRSFIDVNRGLNEIDTSIIDGDWDGDVSESEKAAAGIGLIWRINQENNNIYDRLLSVDEVKNRISSYWQPYHDCLKETLDEVHAKFGKVVHINCHSMPKMSNESSKEGPGVVRPEICLGDRRGTTCDPRLVELVKTTFEELGYQVNVNEPYAGVELVRAYSNPSAGRHSLQIEIRRDLYMDERTFEKSDNFEKVRKDFETLTKALADFSVSL
ncbi:N-formylglutamate amidohydrolase [Sneathiella limimaris]|uniref:N-formylglutamate amidohydrolase n=1 Tax=Sneathiella limimaris TaxID=1964213 RepID=UPI0019D208A5|nr:N-formylglutamate amidohydrolase [Sneathiella limimaris]